MEKNQADYNKVEKIILGQTDFFKSIGRDADFEWIYYGWDGIEAKRQGKELNTIMVKDLDPALDFYSPVIITSEKHTKQDKDFVKKFMSATTEGYNFAIKEPKESADILIKAVPDVNKDLVQESQKWLSTKYQDDAKAWGVQKEEVWTNYMNFLYDNKVIKKKIDVKDAFTNEFLPSEKMSGLQIKDIVKSFDGKNVLANISASIREGEFVSFVGPSGCGKSTLLNMIANVENPTSGSVTYNDKQIQEQDVVSYMPQQDLLLPWRSALQNIVLPLEIEGKPKTKADRRNRSIKAV